MNRGRLWVHRYEVHPMEGRRWCAGATGVLESNRSTGQPTEWSDSVRAQHRGLCAVPFLPSTHGAHAAAKRQDAASHLNSFQYLAGWPWPRQERSLCSLLHCNLCFRWHLLIHSCQHRTDSSFSMYDPPKDYQKCSL
jgi:hypothetical protein